MSPNFEIHINVWKQLTGCVNRCLFALVLSWWTQVLSSLYPVKLWGDQFEKLWIIAEYRWLFTVIVRTRTTSKNKVLLFPMATWHTKLSPYWNAIASGALVLNSQVPSIGRYICLRIRSNEIELHRWKETSFSQKCTDGILIERVLPSNPCSIKSFIILLHISII